MNDPCFRHCWDCGKISHHKDSITPEVCCKRCKSQDTRRITLKPCPFCGQPAEMERSPLNEKDYWIVGCRTPKCFGSIANQTAAVPDEQVRGLVAIWNRRPEK